MNCTWDVFSTWLMFLGWVETTVTSEAKRRSADTNGFWWVLAPKKESLVGSKQISTRWQKAIAQHWSPKDIIVKHMQPFVSQRCPSVVYHFSGAHWRLALALMAEMQAGGCWEAHSFDDLPTVVMFHGYLKRPEPRIVYIHKYPNVVWTAKVGATLRSTSRVEILKHDQFHDEIGANPYEWMLFKSTMSV